MRQIPRLAAVAAVSAMLVAAAGAHASASPGGVDHWSGAVVAHDAALTAQQRQAVLDHWTPQRMADAVPIEERVGDLVGDLPRGAEATRGAPLTIEPTAAGDPAGSEVQAFPFGGGPWTGGGLVTQTVGRVFFDFQGQPSSCSGNAVTSDNRSVVMTAGHCIKLQGSFHTNWVFVPGYDNGNAPFGTWPAAMTFITPQWNASENISFDIGAVVVGTVGGQRLTDVVGGQGVAFNQPRGLAMYAFGYPAAPPYDGSQLIYCSGNTFNNPFIANTIGMTCDMTGGSSGGPWLFNFNEGTGAGIQNSVNSFGLIFFPGIMWGPYFGSEGQAVYQAAESA